jgi:ribosomal protein L40E
MSISCPKCGLEVSSPPEREWRFQQYRVSRFRCERGDKFNLYSGTTRTFTIPRSATDKNQCRACKTGNPSEAIFCKNCGIKL